MLNLNHNYHMKYLLNNRTLNRSLSVLHLRPPLSGKKKSIYLYSLLVCDPEEIKLSRTKSFLHVSMYKTLPSTAEKLIHGNRI